MIQLVTPIKVGEIVYVLFGYSLMPCKVLSIGRKRFKVEGKAHTFHEVSTHFVGLNYIVKGRSGLW